MKRVSTLYSVYRSYEVHIIFALFTLHSYLLPASCSLLPAPCSLLPAP
ncbi:hypothetical protein [Moorena producens]|nr:hypothetical protein [Moorena producens]